MVLDVNVALSVLLHVDAVESVAGLSESNAGFSVNLKGLDALFFISVRGSLGVSNAIFDLLHE